MSGLRSDLADGDLLNGIAGNDDRESGLVSEEEPEQLLAAQTAVRHVNVSEAVNDYLLDIDGVEVGDAVIIMTDRGKTEVTVADISEKVESELALPIGKYKNILEKVQV